MSDCIAVNPLKGISPVLLARKQTQAAPIPAWWTADPEGGLAFLLLTLVSQFKELGRTEWFTRQKFPRKRSG